MFKVTGLKETIKHLETLANRMEASDGTHNVSSILLLHDGFISAYTDYKSHDAFFDAMPFEFESQEEFEAIDQDKLDRFVSSVSDFDTWEEMLFEAGADYFRTELGNT